jgi:hypothetical protein
MNELTPRDRRLVKELENMRHLVQDSSFVRFEARPDEHFPEEYVVTFSCLGLVRRPQASGAMHIFKDWRSRRTLDGISESHVAHIYLPASYPDLPPLVQFMPPGLYHPNIRNLKEEDFVAHVTEETGGIADVRQALERSPELRGHMQQQLGAYVCLDALKSPKDKGNYTRRITLYDICNELGQMIMLQIYNLGDPWDPDAAEWTKWAEKKGLLPLDDRPFLDKLPPVVRVLHEPAGPNLGIEAVPIN